MKKIKKINISPKIIASIISILLGILIGFLLLIVLKPSDAFGGLGNILFTGFSSLNKMGKVLYQAMPLILTGLSVGLSFKTGLFNIGASGQFLLGSFFALFSALVLKWPWYLCMMTSIIGGSIWGSLPGLLKALLNVNEVISSIMFNWIGLFLINVLIANNEMMLGSYYGSSSDRTASLQVANKDAILPKMFLNDIFNNDTVSIGIIIAVLVAILIFVLINKTIFGYELKAVGYNRHASKYAGINATKNIILAMVISGGLAGLGGGLYYLNGGVQYTILKVMPAIGFNGISVALLGQSNPIAIIFSALFVSYIQVGGEAMQPEFASEVITIITSIIIYLSAFSLIISKLVINKKKRRKLGGYISDNNK